MMSNEAGRTLAEKNPSQKRRNMKMAETEGSLTSYWIKFFKSAGVPVGDAANYALAFSDNRIQKAMLMDLNKEYLNDMGINRLGDVIAILKHAKSVHGEDAREKILQASRSSPVPQGILTHTAIKEAVWSSPSNSPNRKGRSTPASRIVDHYIGKDPQAAPMNQPSPPHSGVILTTSSAGIIKLNTTKQKDVVPVPKKRRVFPEHEGKYKIFMPSGTTAKTKKILEQKRLSITESRMGVKSSVFERLGGESDEDDNSSSSSPALVTVTGLDKIVLRNTEETAGSSVFGRLGGKSTIKRAATSTSVDLDDGDISVSNTPLQYEGVLKSPPKKAKPSPPTTCTTKFKVTLKKTSRQQLGKAPSREKADGRLASDIVEHTGVSVKNRLASDMVEHTGVSVKNRLGVVTAPASSTTTSGATSSGKNTVKLKRKSLPSKGKLINLKSANVHTRLGVTGEVSSSGGSVVSSTAGKTTKGTAGVKPKGVFGRLGQQM